MHLKQMTCQGHVGKNGGQGAGAGEQGAGNVFGRGQGIEGQGEGKAGRGVVRITCSMYADLDCANHRHVEEQWNEGGPQAPLQGDV